jgi:cytosine/adenosine deaminase-related metal-dependent hydrolase
MCVLVVSIANKIGSLTPGKHADLAIFIADSLTVVGWNQLDPVGSVVMQPRARDVDTVIVGGNIVKRKGHLLADVGKAKSVLREASERISRKVADSGGYLVHKGRVSLF